MQSQRSAIDAVSSSGPRFSVGAPPLLCKDGAPSPAFDNRSARKQRRGAVGLAVTLCVAVSATQAQTITETVDASDMAAMAVPAGGFPTCDPAHGPCFDPFAPGSPFEGCRTPVLNQQGCFASAPAATTSLVELAVCMANVRAGFPAPPGVW